MKFGSVCSGIEAASVAWAPLGWEAAWFSEIEPFPCAVLNHHYPDVPNLGDMTLLPENILSGNVEAPDVLCGGTPCQAFSVAGKRKSLEDARGNLSLTFCEIANAIDTVRIAAGQQPTIIFWENVPGVLNTADNAFGCFLGELAGEDCALEPPGGKWSNAGCVHGPKRTIAYRVLDAQYFGVAQRRRRVFVVASARDGFDPGSVLFEFESMRRDTAPSRETREETTGGSTRSLATSSGRAPDGNETVGALLARDYKGFGNQDMGDGRGLVLQPAYGIAGNIIGRKPENGGNGEGICEEIGYTLTKTDQHGVAHPITFHVDAMPDQMNFSTETSASLTCSQHAGVAYSVYPIDSMNHIGRGDGHSLGDFVENAPQYTLTKGHHHAVAYGVGESPEVAHCLRAGASKADKHESTTYITQPIAMRESGQGYWMEDDKAGTLRAEGENRPSRPSHVVAQPVAPPLTASNDPSRSPQSSEVTQQVAAVHAASMAVRRLTPVECERLQGFPDNYTMIPWRKKDATECPDGPRYKALGNSWAVPNVRWIGERIMNELNTSTKINVPTQEKSVLDFSIFTEG